MLAALARDSRFSPSSPMGIGRDVQGIGARGHRRGRWLGDAAPSVRSNAAARHDRTRASSRQERMMPLRGRSGSGYRRRRAIARCLPCAELDRRRTVCAEVAPRLDGRECRSESFMVGCRGRTQCARRRRARNDLSTPEEGTYLGVAGGPDLFVVALSVKNEHFAQAVSDTAVDGEVVLTVGGQPGRFARRSLVDAATARVAAEAPQSSRSPPPTSPGNGPRAIGSSTYSCARRGRSGR